MITDQIDHRCMNHVIGCIAWRGDGIRPSATRLPSGHVEPDGDAPRNMGGGGAHTHHATSTRMPRGGMHGGAGEEMAGEEGGGRGDWRRNGDGGGASGCHGSGATSAAPVVCRGGTGGGAGRGRGRGRGGGLRATGHVDEPRDVRTTPPARLAREIGLNEGGAGGRGRRRSLTGPCTPAASARSSCCTP